MPIDMCYVITLLSRMCVIPCCFWSGIIVLTCFLLHHTLTTSGTVYHTEHRHAHVHMVPLDHYRAIDCCHRGLEPTYGGDHARLMHSITYGPE